jgi:hypothetical protein
LLTGTVVSLVAYFSYSSHTFSMMEKKVVLDFVESLLSRLLPTDFDVIDANHIFSEGTIDTFCRKEYVLFLNFFFVLFF